MGYFPVRYNSRVIIYDHRGFIRLATDGIVIFQSLDVCIIENLASSIKLPKQVQKFAKYQSKTIPNISQKLLKVCQSGEILPNLVTLAVGDNGKISYVQLPLKLSMFRLIID